MLLSSPPRVLTPNRLLAALPRDEYARLLPLLSWVRLAQGETLYETGSSVRHAYFPVGGMLSLLSSTEDGQTVEVAMVGNEGMVGVPILLRVDQSPYKVMAHIPTTALRIKAEALIREWDRGGQLQFLSLRYIHTLLAQISQSCACNRFHSVEQRLCRWLLTGRDRVKSDTLQLTQEILSNMLGSPRTSITAIAGTLQTAGLISYQRGKLTITDLPGLEAASCECYRIIRDGNISFHAA